MMQPDPTLRPFGQPVSFGRHLLPMLFCVAVLSSGCHSLWNGSREISVQLNGEEKDLAEALARYSHALIAEKELPADPKVAIAQFEKAIKLDRNTERIHIRYAHALAKSDLLTDAISSLKKADKTLPNSVEIQKGLGLISQKAGDPDNAIKYYARVLKLNPVDSECSINLAGLYFNMENDSKAIAVLKRAIKNNKHTSDILSYAYLWGRKFIEEKDSLRSVPCLNLVVDHYPGNKSEFYSLLGDLYDNLGHSKEAINHYIKASIAKPADAGLAIKLSQLQFTIEPSEAINTLLQAKGRMPETNTQIRYALALIYSADEQFSNAIDIFKEVQNIHEKSKNPQPPSFFYLHYGAAVERSRNLRKAEEIFEKGVELYPNNHEILNYVSYMWAEEGKNLDKALKYIQRALKHQPANGAYLDTLGWVFFKQNKFNKALDEISKARELINNDPTIEDHLGDTYFAIKNKDQALAHWKQSLLLDPENKTVSRKLISHGVNTKRLIKDARKKAKMNNDEMSTE